MAKRKSSGPDPDVQTLMEKVDEFFSDTSRSQRATLSGLMELRDHVQIQIEAIEDDLRRDRG